MTATLWACVCPSVSQCSLLSAGLYVCLCVSLSRPEKPSTASSRPTQSQFCSNIPLHLKSSLGPSHEECGDVCYVADLSQNAVRARTSCTLPAHCRSSLFCSISKQCLFTHIELAASQGWPAKGLTPSKYDEVFKPFEQGRSRLSFKDHTELLGNGMHLGAVASVYYFICSHVMWRQDLQNFSWSSALACQLVFGYGIHPDRAQQSQRQTAQECASSEDCKENRAEEEEVGS